MNPIFNQLLEPYQGVETHLLVLEILGVFFGLLSVLFSKRDNILVFPTGIISTLIFVYILLVYGLLGDMLINVYYFIMSVYGWYMWTRKVSNEAYLPITSWTKNEQRTSLILFMATLVGVALVYQVFNKWENWVSYADVVTTGIFFVGMWLMAKKKIENWLFWIVGDFVSIPMYIYKGLLLTAIQYFIFGLIAIFAYYAWKKNLNKPKTELLK
ncbi:nicotinamide riboside transporter PnuC [Psychroflexus planctonicus]|uniref:Nicotinamide riboside transporter PnuC n=1 Tax=Psychroflexus planctonicus TaxID=1526575 RepID=A0ABQ1SCU6_9FLAO|nr:nicotinamide riboside transporter PnuC [Psychroflexus planctonicus]GGE26066.1 nicotinamide mononucleotide transporter [Psychroflexus planctonicus]